MADSSPSPSAAPAPNPARLGTLYARGSVDDEISDEELAAGIKEALGKLGPRKKVIILPPDITRLMSKSGGKPQSSFLC